MNGYTLTKKMRQTREWYKLGPYEQALYHELVAICNEQNWIKVFWCSNKQLSKALNVSVRTVIKTRKTLIDAGLISFDSGKKAGFKNAYSLHTAITEPIEPGNPPPIEPWNPPPFEPRYPPPGTSGSTYIYKTIKHNKTPSISPLQGDCDFEVEIEKKTYVPLHCLKEYLLGDATWIQSLFQKFNISPGAIDQLPGYIDQFLHHIIAMGQENSVQTLPAAKRRFTLWWNNQKITQHENKQFQNLRDTEIW